MRTLMTVFGIALGLILLTDLTACAATAPQHASGPTAIPRKGDQMRILAQSEAGVIAQDVTLTEDHGNSIKTTVVLRIYREGKTIKGADSALLALDCANQKMRVLLDFDVVPSANATRVVGEDKNVEDPDFADVDPDNDSAVILDAVCGTKVSRHGSRGSVTL